MNDDLRPLGVPDEMDTMRQRTRLAGIPEYEILVVASSVDSFVCVNFKPRSVEEMVHSRATT